MTTQNDSSSNNPDRAAQLNQLADMLRAAADRLGDELRALYPEEPALHPDGLVGCRIDEAWDGPVYLRNLADRIRAAINPMFDRWHREMDGPLLVLVRENADHSIAEWIELDVRELPERPDLLGRLGTKARERLLADAKRTAKNMAEESALDCREL